MNKLLVLAGPTATGKTDMALSLARKFNGEVVSADSRQVYKGMDIGTGKGLLKDSRFKIHDLGIEIKTDKYSLGFYEINQIKVWLYDIVSPDQVFSAGEYAELSRVIIEDIWRRKKLPILTGGTGFYVKAAIEGIGTIRIPPDWKLRGELEKFDKPQLQSKLKILNPEKWQKMNTSDRNNPRRLIRAIEIAKSTTENSKKLFKRTEDVLYIGLTAPREFLYKRIDNRVEERIKEGIIDEIKNLFKKGYSWDDPGFNTLGYKEWQTYFNGESPLGEVIQRWNYNEHAYARRQLTWFKKNKKIRWYDTSKPDFEENVTEDIGKWYYKIKK